MADYAKFREAWQLLDDLIEPLHREAVSRACFTVDQQIAYVSRVLAQCWESELPADNTGITDQPVNTSVGFVIIVILLIDFNWSW